MYYIYYTYKFRFVYLSAHTHMMNITYINIDVCSSH